MELGGKFPNVLLDDADFEQTVPLAANIAIQTNLSAPIGEFLTSDREALALWTTFHPTQTSLSRFVGRCHRLDEASIRYSVGVVGLREHFDEIQKLRGLLAPGVYLWVNAYKRDPDYYRPGEVERMLAVDPHFHWNLKRYASAGLPCRAGETSFSVDGDGNVRRCHFISEVIGNIYAPDFSDSLRPRLCTAASCGCHIGYIHRPELGLERLYGAGLLERIPSGCRPGERER